MKASLQYYLSVFLRRLPWFLIPALAFSAVGVIVAMSLPPTYVSQARFVIEGSQIPDQLAPPTVQSEPLEKLQILEQRLLSRANLLDVARRVDVPGQAGMNADALTQMMRASTRTQTITSRGGASQMTLSFSSGNPQTAAAVVNEYLNLIQREDVESRAGSASQTLAFFQQEVDRLSTALNEQSARILEFKSRNADALPQDQGFRQRQQADLQDRIDQIDRDVATLAEQRARLVQVFETTGQIQPAGGDNRNPDQRRLDELRTQLNQALAVYAPDNPRIRILKGQIAQMESVVAGAGPATPGASPITLQLAEIDSRVTGLGEQQTQVRADLARVTEALTRATGNSVALDALERDYANIQSQYGAAQNRLAEASTGERIELQSRGQRITVLEQPVAPTVPASPNRTMIAAAGVGFGIAFGLALVLGLELLNRSPRRPEDLVKKLGIMPIATIPYVRSSREVVWQRSLKAATVLLILIGVPATVWGIHTYYQPLDLLAERLKGGIGL